MGSQIHQNPRDAKPLSELPYYPDDWEEHRRDVFERDKYRCRNCDRLWYEEGGTAKLHAHHIVPVGQLGSHQICNIVALCAYCHAAAHGITYAPAVQIPRELERFIDNDVRAVRPHPDDDVIRALAIPLRAVLDEASEDLHTERRLNIVPNPPASEVIQQLTNTE